jgi:hypothetical protein
MPLKLIFASISSSADRIEHGMAMHFNLDYLHLMQNTCSLFDKRLLLHFDNWLLLHEERNRTRNG